MNKEINPLGRLTENKLYRLLQKNGYYVLFILWFLMEIIINCSTAGQKVPHSVYISIQRILKYALIFYIIFFQQYSIREILIIVPTTFLFYYSARLSHFHELFYTWLLIIGLKKSDFDKIVFFSLWMLGICIPVYGILCKLSIFPDAGVFRGDQFRTALGFIHPNSFGVRIFIFSACWYYIRRSRLCAADFIFIVLLSLFVWFVPNSRTSSLCMILLSVLLFLYSKPSFTASPFRSILNSLLVACAALANIGTVLLSLFYSENNRIMLLIDKALSGRLSIANQLYHELGITLFGQRIYVNMSERIYAGLGTTAINFDNSYMRILLHWGIIVYVVVSVLVIWGLIYEKRRKNPTLFLILFMVLVYSFSEKILYQGTYCVFILALSDLLYSKLPKRQSIQHSPTF